MGYRNSGRRLIVNADDFGRSQPINQAVARAHIRGILTSASLMVTGDCVEEAIEFARHHPRLGVGLHLTLVCGRSALPRYQIPGLVGEDRSFPDDPVAAGIRYFFQRSLVPQLEREIAAQFQRFHQTGLPLDHVNGHLNIHLHPTVLSLLIRNAKTWGINSLRLTRDPLALNLRLAHGRLGYRLSHAMIFRLLSRRAQPRLDRLQIRYTRHVFGLLQNAQVNERYLCHLLPSLPAGDSELYSHPCLDKFREEADALVSPTVRRVVEEQRIQLIRYQDL